MFDHNGVPHGIMESVGKSFLATNCAELKKKPTKGFRVKILLGIPVHKKSADFQLCHSITTFWLREKRDKKSAEFSIQVSTKCEKRDKRQTIKESRLTCFFVILC
jgi:hypothetical protein